ncbi:hypothetical protein JG688_00005272 [Phytophthora aleatoria]|uniref:Uncharacterized protein n=1 Tax=Phytophthora aleatoria TaxID=2496075 RepID=A0A8J5IVB8_9STRA|nr:hypothetical protein JG688_00005272 [Phytophthora aleatoria]
MDDPETFEVVLGLKDSCSRRGGWLKIGDWKTGHRTESMSSDFWNLYEELEGQIPDEPARKSSGEGSSDFFADNDCEILHTIEKWPSSFPTCVFSNFITKVKFKNGGIYLLRKK